MKVKSYLIFLAFLGILALFPLAAPFSFSIDPNQSTLFKAIPMEITNWKGRDVPVDERTYEILETRNVLSRTYENPGKEAVHLLIVSSMKDRRVAHPPEVCYLSSNYTILDEKNETLGLGSLEIPLKSFVAKNKNRLNSDEKVFYVYKVGKKFTTNYFTQQLQFAWDRLTRQESQVLLIRVAGAQDEALKDFLAEVIPHVS